MSIVSDKEFWDKVTQDDPAAFTPLFEKYWEEMFSIAYRRLKDESQAKEIVQNIFIHCWDHRHHIQVTQNLAPYLLTALKYSIVRHLYRSAKKGVMELPLSVFNIPDEEKNYEQDWQEFDQLQQTIRLEVANMPGRMREIFILSREQELSIREIAMRLSLSEQTVKNQLHTALKRLRSRLQHRAFFLPFM
ncbi:RNA polymerase sigma factor [Chitinophaga eiseniae]|uniref:Sigma-70 family RNA polymerase sigma factor n=1 Tax=Chitinophaga eiseniae TaxID=634771 RepID=A0A847SMX2_9BACT|nr:sigma-70 family RNA polymerase sigma factor [Chitinophaga eiseniae]NLR80207.1 sigma-70 family RNA polymerase sigma factor [Chitinophaga eiseniae]